MTVARVPPTRLAGERPMFVEVAGGVWIAAGDVIALHPSTDDTDTGRGWLSFADGSRFRFRDGAELPDYLAELDPPDRTTR